MSSHDNVPTASDVKTSYPGHITNFNPEEQTVTVTLAIENLFTGFNEAYQIAPNTVIHNVPLKFVQGGGWSFTHPVPDGTPCLVHFSQQGIDHWLEDSSSSAGLINGLPHPSFGRKWNINDCFCDIGYQPRTKTIGNFQPDVLELRNASRSRRVTLSDDDVVIIAGATRILVNADDSVEVISPTKTTVKSPQIFLDGDTIVTKSLTVKGGMSVSGSTNGATALFEGNFKMIGNMEQMGTFTLDGKVVNIHKHDNPEGGEVGVMK